MRFFAIFLTVIWVAGLLDATPGFARNKDFPPVGSLKTAQEKVLVVDEARREYLIQPVTEGAGPFPIVILLHGGTQTDKDVWVQTSLPTLAARDHFILVAPQAHNHHWDDGRGATLSGEVSTTDDVTFIHDLITQVVTQNKGDKNAVFLVGISNGGFMTMHYACSRAEDLRAAAVAAADMPVDDSNVCRPSKPLPWLAMNGKKDRLIPFAGQPAGVVENSELQAALLSADQSFDFWATKDGCAPNVSVEKLTAPSDSDDWAERRTRSGCKDGAVSVQYMFNDAGHTWPGGRRGLITAWLGGVSETVDAGTAIWDFFRATLPANP